MRPALFLLALPALGFAHGIVPAALTPSAVAFLALAPSARAQTTTPPPIPPVPPPSNGAPTRGAITTDAPTPNNIPEQVAPADRAGNNTTDPAGPVRSTPFSAGPQGGTGGQISPSLRETEPTNSPSTPALGR